MGKLPKITHGHTADPRGPSPSKKAFCQEKEKPGRPLNPRVELNCVIDIFFLKRGTFLRGRGAPRIRGRGTATSGRFDAQLLKHKRESFLGRGKKRVRCEGDTL